MMEVESDDEFTKQDYIQLLARCRQQDQHLIKIKNEHNALIERLLAENKKLKKLKHQMF